MYLFSEIVSWAEDAIEIRTGKFEVKVSLNDVQ